MATMAQINPAVTPETLITIKVIIGAENKKTKLPLKDLKPDVLPSKLRSFLSLPPGRDYIFERYSDSAGSFVELDGSNPSVYKQLNRAAKAKLKLRIRAVPAVAATAAQLPSFQSLINDNTADLASLQISSDNQQQPNVEAAASSQAQRDSQIENMSQQLDGVNAHLDQVKNTMASDYAAAFGSKIPSFGLQQSTIDLPSYPSPPYSLFSVCCNKCGYAIPDHHWHCRICHEGDYDLCQSCLDAGAHCDDPSHYLLKRRMEDGKVINSTTETFSKTTIGGTSASAAAATGAAAAAPAAAPAAAAPAAADVAEPIATHVAAEIPGAFADASDEAPGWATQSRTCNCCISIYDDSNFVTCKDCDDYDLCIACHLRGEHGHHPGHTFGPAIEDMILEDAVAAACEPGRNQTHDAVCDGCDFTITGVRYKCLECPDWDFCTGCYKSAHLIHQGHRFVPIYTQLASAYGCPSRNNIHYGVRCDGDLCRGKKWIVGDRYKCAVCDDTDFCASCEAHPSNPHNRTHPLIKFRTPVREASITTYSEAPGGHTVHGDRQPERSSRGTETTPPVSSNASTQVQTEAARPESAAPEPEPTPAVASTVEASENIDPAEEVAVAPEASVNETSAEEKRREVARYCRHKLQKTYVNRDSHVPKPEEIRYVAFLLKELEAMADLSEEIIMQTKIHKVLKAILKLTHIHGDEQLNLRERFTALLATYKQTLGETEQPLVAEKEVKQPIVEQAPLDAFYIRDYVSDGTKVVPGQAIYQSWTLLNPTSTVWPVGCALRWAGGDQMIDVDMTVPGSVQTYVAASMSNQTYQEVQSGEKFNFNVKLRAPEKLGRAVSYWRLYSPDGKPFGHRLWCDVEVVESLEKDVSEKNAEKAVEKAAEKQVAPETEVEKLSESQMVFPKLDKESPAASTHLSVETAPETIIAEEAEELLSHDDVESVTVDLDDDTTDDGFLTDEDYDMLEDARN